MKSFRVRPASSPLVGEIVVPGDKSIGHRAVIFNAIAKGRSRIIGLSNGEDNRRSVRALQALGVPILDEGERGLQIWGQGLAGLWSSATALDCGNSGTTMRLLAGLLAGANFESVLGGDASLSARPMGRVALPLVRMGARIRGHAGRSASDLLPPLHVGPSPTGGPPGDCGLVGIDYDSPVASAQVKTAVLLAGLFAGGATRVREPQTSRDHTERMLAAMGAPITVGADGVVLDPTGWSRVLEPRGFAVPGDFSSATFLLAAALVVPRSHVLIRGVGLNPSRTGALDVMRAMGGDIEVVDLRDVGGEPVGDVIACASLLRGVRIAGELALRAIDELPLLAALAAHAEGTTLIADAAELRVKESDRIKATAAALARFGAVVEELPDGMRVFGREAAAPRGAHVDSHGDHRIAMASAICALAVDGDTIVDDIANVATSFPEFRSILGSLGAEIEEIDE